MNAVACIFFSIIIQGHSITSSDISFANCKLAEHHRFEINTITVKFSQSHCRKQNTFIMVYYFIQGEQFLLELRKEDLELNNL